MNIFLSLYFIKGNKLLTPDLFNPYSIHNFILILPSHSKMHFYTIL